MSFLLPFVLISSGAAGDGRDQDRRVRGPPAGEALRAALPEHL